MLMTDHWTPGRVGLHMAHAEPYRRINPPRPRRVPPIWRWWMTAATMLIASVVVAIIAWTLLRKGL
jgi:hypothetical protein